MAIANQTHSATAASASGIPIKSERTKAKLSVVKAVPLNEIFSTVAEADAYLDAMQKKVLSGEDDDE